jgi:hypothetical protein
MVLGEDKGAPQKCVCCISYSNALDSVDHFKMGNNMRSVGVLMFDSINTRHIHRARRQSGV